MIHTSIRRSIFFALAALVLVFNLAQPLLNAQAQDEGSGWGEVVDENGNIRFDNLTDLGESNEPAEWMDIPLPFGQEIDLDANYHRYQTPEGNIVVLPSPITLVMMAANPVESGFANATSQVGIGGMAAAEALGALLGNNIDWDRVSSEHPEYVNPSDFWQSVISGNENVWTWFSGFDFLGDLATLSFADLDPRLGLLLYQNGVINCAQVPGGCKGVIPGKPNEPTKTPPTPVTCPPASISQGSPSLSIVKTEPAKPLVIGQDPEKRGADVNISVSIPPVIRTWYERVEKTEDVCRAPYAGETTNCTTASGSPGVQDEEVVGYECRQHIDPYPERITNLTATAALDAASRIWITSDLAGKWYQAGLKKPNIDLVPGFGKYQTGCGGNTCTATASLLKVPFADPGTFNLNLTVQTAGTPYTRARTLNGSGRLQVFLTLVRSLPGGGE